MHATTVVVVAACIRCRAAPAGKYGVERGQAGPAAIALASRLPVHGRPTATVLLAQPQPHAGQARMGKTPNEAAARAARRTRRTSQSQALFRFQIFAI